MSHQKHTLTLIDKVNVIIEAHKRMNLSVKDLGQRFTYTRKDCEILKNKDAIMNEYTSGTPGTRKRKKVTENEEIYQFDDVLSTKKKVFHKLPI